MRIEPDESDDGRGRHGKGDAVGVEYEFLQDEADQIEPERSPEQLGEQEERGSRAVGLASQPVAEVGVDGSQPEPVIEREQHVGDDQIASEKSHARLQIGHVDAFHHARHGDKCDAGQRGTNHPECDQRPRRTSVATEESVIVRSRRCQSGDKQQEGEISCQDEEYVESVHVCAGDWDGKDSESLSFRSVVSPSERCICFVFD